MKPIHHILVPTDFSECAHNAFFYALKIAEITGAQIKVLHVYHPKVKADIELGESYEEALKRLYAFEGWKNLPEGEKIFSAGHVVVDATEGLAVDEIVRLSNTGTYELMVLGTKGAGVTSGKLFGSIASLVAQQSGCPVLLVPENAKYQGFKRVIYGLTGDSNSETIIQEVADWVRLLGGKMFDLVHVQPERLLGKHSVEMIGESLVEIGAEHMEMKISNLVGPTVTEGLSEYADTHHSDLLIVATRHRSFFGEMLHLSETKRLAMTGKLPMLVLHME